MPQKRLKVVVTRRLPDMVETRLSELFDVTLSEDDKPMSRDALANLRVWLAMIFLSAKIRLISIDAFTDSVCRLLL